MRAKGRERERGRDRERESERERERESTPRCKLLPASKMHVGQLNL